MRICPKGRSGTTTRPLDILANDQLLKADYYKPLIVGYHNGAAIKLSDIADVQDSVENIRAAAYYNGKPCITDSVFRQPGANIIDTVDRIRQALPSLQASIPAGIDLTVTHGPHGDHPRFGARNRAHSADFDRAGDSGGVRVSAESARDVDSQRGGAGFTDRHVRRDVSVGLQHRQSFADGADHFHGVRGRRRHCGDRKHQPARGERACGRWKRRCTERSEIGFTVLSMTTSLVAVFIPILLMAGIVGRLFREFAITLSVAILVSLLVSLTMTPMMSARLLKPEHSVKHGWIYQVNERSFNWLHRTYERALHWVLEHEAFTLGILLITIAVNVYLLVIVPKGFFPLQDNGTLGGGIRGSQDISFQTMDQLSRRFVNIIKSRPGGGDGGDLHRRQRAGEWRICQHDSETDRAAKADVRAR